MFCDINNQFFAGQVFAAGQGKDSDGIENIFNLWDGAADGAFVNAVINGDMFHGAGFTPVLEGDKSFIADS
jgi:hypothetical protein